MFVAKRSLQRVLIGVLSIICGVPAQAAHNECENIAGDLVVVGEGRYETKAGDDEYYANVYWGGTDELDLAGVHSPGGASTSSTSLNFGAQVHHEDSTAGGCTNITFGLELERSSERWQATDCPGGSITSSTYNYTVNSCIGGSNAHLVYAGRAFGGSSLSYAPFWKATLEVGAATEESGCFQVLSQNECTLVNY